MLNTNLNICTSTDSYKVSHHSQFPQGLEYTQYYVESRGGMFDAIFSDGFARMVKILEKGVTAKDVKRAKRLFKRHFGSEVFHAEGWNIIANELGGKLPIRIRTVEEGLVVPTKNVLLVIENTDPRFGWLPGYLETFILRAIWYPTTVGTISFETKKIIRSFMNKTVDDDKIASVEPFRLHDFGARGVSSAESAAIGGMSHLKNFLGTDTVEALEAAEDLYGMDIDNFIAGFSIPAREHSTTTIYGETREDDAFWNSINNWGDGLYACVMDSYDYEAAVHRVTTGEFKEAIMSKTGTFVVRPDSGNPIDVVMTALNIIGKNVGYTVNSKGYKVLPDQYRIIQGDGVNMKEIRRILTWMEGQGWSAENVAFGMGGGLLQQLDRDSLRFAMKMCCAVVDGDYREVFKCPKTDVSKASKRGYLDLIRVGDELVTYSHHEFGKVHKDSVMKTIFEDGRVTWDFTLERARELSDVQAG